MPPVNEKILQEIHCTKSGGGCGGFFRCKLNVCLNRKVEMVCPNCGHKHRRSIKDGVVHEEGRHAGTVQEQITPPKSAFSEEPHTKKLKKWAGKDSKKERDGAVISNEKSMLSRFLSDLWGETSQVNEREI